MKNTHYLLPSGKNAYYCLPSKVVNNELFNARTKAHNFQDATRRMYKKRDLYSGKDKSVLSRELKCNSSKSGYFPPKAEELSLERKERFSRKRKFTNRMKVFVRDKISTEQWSPPTDYGLL